MSAQKNFKTGQSVVYPAHGVGKITGFDTMEAAGQKLEVITISCERGMVLRVPKSMIEKTGLRHLSNEDTITKAFETLRDSPRHQQGIWARRVKDLEEKLNSGNLIILCRLLRDLAPRNRSERGLSYSERLYYEQAMMRASTEIGLSRKKPVDTIKAEMEKALSEQKPPIVVVAHA